MTTINNYLTNSNSSSNPEKKVPSSALQKKHCSGFSLSPLGFCIRLVGLTAGVMDLMVPIFPNGFPFTFLTLSPLFMIPPSMNLPPGNQQMPHTKGKENKTKDHHSQMKNNEGSFGVEDIPHDSSGNEDDTGNYTFHGISIITFCRIPYKGTNNTVVQNSAQRDSKPINKGFVNSQKVNKVNGSD